MPEEESIESFAKLFQSGYSFFSLMSDKEKTNEQVMRGIEATYNALCENPNWKDNPHEGIIAVVNAIEDIKIRKVYQSAAKTFLRTKPIIFEKKNTKPNKPNTSPKTRPKKVSSIPTNKTHKPTNVPMMIGFFFLCIAVFGYLTNL